MLTSLIAVKTIKELKEIEQFNQLKGYYGNSSNFMSASELTDRIRMREFSICICVLCFIDQWILQYYGKQRCI